jgi:hypothetical protein
MKNEIFLGGAQLGRKNEARTLSMKEARMEFGRKRKAEGTSQNYYF